MALLLPILLVAFRTLDRIIRIMHDRYREAWDAFGRPSGMFWRSEEEPTRGSMLAWQKACVFWTFKSPLWAAQDQEVMTLLRRLRFAVMGWNIGVIALSAIFVSRYGFPWERFFNK